MPSRTWGEGRPPDNYALTLNPSPDGRGTLKLASLQKGLSPPLPEGAKHAFAYMG